MKYFLLISILTFFSCASYKPSFQLEPNKNFWLGKTGDDLAVHPLFASMPMDARKTESGIETRSFKNSAGLVSSAGCYGGNCVGTTEEVACKHVFIIKGNLINNYIRSGNCSEEIPEYRPRKEDGNPVFSKTEIDQYNEYFGDRKPSSQRNCNAIGRFLKAQGC